VARDSVSADYSRRGIDVPPERVVITASSSESYSFLFKLLCDPGDAVLVPVPGYPLFEYLTRLDGVEARPYRLGFESGRWAVDVGAVRALVDSRTRAVLVVTPNNPTGSRLEQDVLGTLTGLCREHGLAVIGDEVFADYVLDPAPSAVRSVLDQAEVLAFGLGGLSKTVGLPQAKLGWIGVSGPRVLVDEALTRLEIIGDAYLSVSPRVQHDAPRLLTVGTSVRAQIADRVLLNYRTLMRSAAEFPACSVPRVEGGWSAVVQGPAVMADDDRALALLRHEGVLVHPGYLFDFDREGYFVVSLLVAPENFQPAILRVLHALSEP
jgi:hypothetical protein